MSLPFNFVVALIPTGILENESGDGGRERGANGVECLVNATSQCAHAGGCAESDESHDQSIFNQILAFFLILQGLELQIEVIHKILHSSSLSAQSTQQNLRGDC